LFSGLIKGRRVVNGRHRLRASSQLSRVDNDPKQLVDWNGRFLLTPTANSTIPTNPTWPGAAKRFFIPDPTPLTIDH
jgi:hypothetical protein